jgi:RNA polymerase sigma-70 factor (ECF subfamily)
MTDAPPDPRHAALLDAGRAAWPGLRVDEAAYRLHLERLARDAAPPVERASDLYLAFACSLGGADALRAFDPILIEAVRSSATRVDPSPDFASEVAQVLRKTLLVDLPPKIATYAGRSALRTWLGVAALRAAQRLLRRKGDDPKARAPETDIALPTPTEGPEGAYLRARYREHFADALRAALTTLSPRERTYLRVHLVERASTERLGEIHGVSKSTAARWLAAARERLIAETRAQMKARLGLSRSEYESLVGLVRSDIDVSVARLLGTNG